MRICEEYASVQGEGKYIGVPSYFIRTVGCQLRCAWKNKDGTITICDTPYTSWDSESGYDLDLSHTLSSINKNIKHIVITGGEPTLQKDLKDIVNSFIDRGYVVTIETNGIIHIDGIDRAFISLSPKLSSTYAQHIDSREYILHRTNNKFIEGTSKWIKSNDYQLKFVVNDESDIVEINDIVKKLGISSDKVYLMPQGISTEQLKEKEMLIFNACLEFGYNFSSRLHINLFGYRRGV